MIILHPNNLICLYNLLLHLGYMFIRIFIIIRMSMSVRMRIFFILFNLHSLFCIKSLMRLIYYNLVSRKSELLILLLIVRIYTIIISVSMCFSMRSILSIVNFLFIYFHNFLMSILNLMLLLFSTL